MVEKTPIEITCLNGRITGALFIKPCSFKKAITEPENVTAPTRIPNNISTILAVAIYPLISKPNAAGDKKAAHATKTADMPPIEFKAATI